ncbi:TPA: DNA-protecting protein DprA [Streptococcus equi subsp. zooepidemicus]|nr:DNA-protecting protein DprA [Streptococcus equi subsp. zooepidemicus]HEL1229263.1 DNA-protecting protein DprA [Streptococcus equi subsp. zooepidemicus]
MNNFELYKLKKAGLTNLNILNLIDYQQRNDKSLSLRDIAVVSCCKNPVLFIETYKQLNVALLKKEFNQFPSLSILDKQYPLALREIYNPPVLLFYQGDLSLLEKPKLAVVGSRKSSEIGTRSVYKIIKELKNHFVIVSGLARGIDTSAHLACLKAGGQTIAVIGTGLDRYYPKENHQLQEFLSQRHLVLSEYGAGEAALSYHFPERNRIIAGLSRGVLVVEAKQRSGSLITCQLAMEEGRDIFVVPDNILNGTSAGCLKLIKDGASCVTHGRDILSEYHYS